MLRTLLRFRRLGVELIQIRSDQALLDWGTRVLLWVVIGAIVIGMICGEVLGTVLLWAYRQPFSEGHSTITVGLALSIAVLAVVRLNAATGCLPSSPQGSG